MECTRWMMATCDNHTRGDAMTAISLSAAHSAKLPANSRNFRCGAGLACLVAAYTWSGGARAQVSAPAPSATSSTDLGEITVTATRRAETIDTIPISVTAFTQERMDQQAIKTVD